LAFFQIRDFVDKVDESVEVEGSLWIRDGLPIFDPNGDWNVRGALLTFTPSVAARAYARISEMEPETQYRWHQIEVKGVASNVLAGRSPTKGSERFDRIDWDGWSDPLFTSALEVVEETLVTSQEFSWDLKPLFRLQMAYLLLWTSIERYLSLRYSLGEEVMKRVNRLAEEPSFRQGLRDHVAERRSVQRADRPGTKVTLDPDVPDKALWYYYQVRSNITHRGKGVVRDFELLRKSIGELLPIFREVLRVAELDAQFPTRADQ